MAKGDVETTSGGGFEITVTRGVFDTRGEAKLAANQKTVRNLEIAVKRSTAALEGLKGTLKGIKADLVEARKRLKYWEDEQEGE